MKTTRVICIVFAWLWIALICLISIENISKLDFEEIGYAIGTLIGYGIILMPSFILFFIAKKIRKKIERTKREALINSFDSI